MKNNKGITMVALVITIIILIILSGISINIGSSIIEKSRLENLKTNMLLIKVKGQEYVENANFNLGTSIDTLEAEAKNERIQKAKENLKGEEITDISDFSDVLSINQEELNSLNSQYTYYYKLTEQNISDMGIANVESNEDEGWFIIKYDVKNGSVEIYNDYGAEKDGTTYYSLNEIQKLNI